MFPTFPVHIPLQCLPLHLQVVPLQGLAHDSHAPQADHPQPLVGTGIPTSRAVFLIGGLFNVGQNSTGMVGGGGGGGGMKCKIRPAGA